ncbi:MAG: DUF1559 domain-containing protein [Pirellulaceae bacterium]|nr:DUF1559 domain-containing protein [Planctomycetales bacterium]
MKRKRNSAFTLVELLVVITIIGMLAAIALPAINGARESARKLECSNNQNQIAKAVLAYSTEKSQFPARVGLFPGQQLSQFNPSSPSANDVWMSWAVRILPNIDRQDLYDALQSAYSGGAANYATVAEQQYLEIYTCPSDPPANRNAALRVVVNSGMDDINYNPINPKAAPDDASTGVFHDQRGRNKPKVDQTYLAQNDGSATTLMLAEITVPAGSTADHKFYDFATETNTGFIWTANEANSNQPPIGKIATAPGSRHRNGVNVAFCDGHTQFLRSDIDYLVYWHLMTSNGKLSNVPPQVSPLAQWLQFRGQSLPAPYSSTVLSDSMYKQ